MAPGTRQQRRQSCLLGFLCSVFPTTATALVPVRPLGLMSARKLRGLSTVSPACFLDPLIPVVILRLVDVQAPRSQIDPGLFESEGLILVDSGTPSPRTGPDTEEVPDKC